MERTLFAFIWKNSKRDQLLLLLITLTLFPLLYLTLELPKRIINDAIGASAETVIVLGFTLSQSTYLFVLCGIFLLAVLVHGLMKMRINTMKGVLSERLLRRFRYTLIARTLRFPASYFERTSQGEIVSMVTSESEPMGGLMGDAIAQPVLQAGQMLTILGFLFIQSTAFGLAACALIPLQAWLIPKLQRQVNLLNKKRVVQVRALASQIGEGANGAATLRLHGGWRYRLALISERLGTLYAIRFEIFQKKFFMKFLNNFIGQITPFFFYAIGGYLAIKGEITIGALVAALAAHKDLSSPWKELLVYYNQLQDMSLRWTMISERFAPPGIIDATLFEDSTAEIPSLAGDIELSGVSVRDEDGNVVLDDITATFPAGQLIAISAPSDEDRLALSAVLTREILPSSGTVTFAGHNLSGLHQSVVAGRVGHATSRPVLFMGTFGDNMLMPLSPCPNGGTLETDINRESARAGNSTDTSGQDWINPALARVSDYDALRDWWRDLVKGMGSEDALFRRGLDLRFDPEAHNGLARATVDLRSQVAQAVADAGLDGHVWTIDDTAYNPALPVIDNLLFALPRQKLTAMILSEQTEFLQLLEKLKLEGSLLQLSVDIVEIIRQIFGLDGVGHPLFLRLGLDATDYENAVALVAIHKSRKSLATLQKAQLLIVPFSISAEIMGMSFPDEITAQVMAMRREHGPALQASMKDIFAPIVEDQPMVGLSVLENALFGKISQTAGRKGDAVRSVVADTLREEGLEALVLNLILETPVGLGGGNLPSWITEPLALSRATIKSPDVLVLDTVMGSHDLATRGRVYANLHRLLSKTTIICLDGAFEELGIFDMNLTMQQGRISADVSAAIDADVTRDEGEETLSSEQADKIRILEQSDLFSTLDRKQLKLLAFGARWYSAQAGEYIFHKDDDPASGAFLIIKGEADLLMPNPQGEDTLISTAGPSTIVGELGLIRNVPRALDMRAKTDLTSLRIGAEEFLAVVENDAATAFKLLQVVAGYVGK